MAVPKKPRVSRSKSETESQFNDLVDTHASSEPQDTRAAEIKKRNNDEIRKAGKSVSLDSVVKDTGTLGLEIGRTLAAISEKISAKVTELALLQQAVELEKQELEDLHGKDIVASQIAALITDHEAKKAEINADLATMHKHFADTKAYLEKEYKEREAEIKKIRERDAADYQYRISQEQRRANDEMEDRIRTLVRQSNEKQEQLQKSWDNREAELKAKETRIAEMEKQVAEFPEVLKKEVAKEVAIVGSTVKREHEHAAKLAALSAEGDKRALTQEIDSYKRHIAQLELNVSALRAELTAVSGNVVEIATQAVQSASGRQALESLKEVQLSGTQSQPSKGK